MITVTFPIILNKDESSLIRKMQKEQSSIIRCVYKMAQSGIDEKSMRHILSEKYPSVLDSWYKQSAIYSGRGMFSSDKSRNIKSRIFGGKLNLIKRAKGKITNLEWKEKRILPLYIIGEAAVYGNRKFKFKEDNVVFKPFKGVKICINLPKLRKNYQEKWKRIVELANRKKSPITVSITHNSISFSFIDALYEKFKNPIESRYAGIDMNPNYIGVSVFDSGKLLSTKMFSLKELTGKSKLDSKIKHETREIGHSIGEYLKYLQVSTTFVEELNFKPGDSNLGKNFNRLTKNQWKRNDFLAALGKYYKLRKINAAYSSTIGNVMNPELPDPIAASAEIARRGFEIFIKKSKKFYPSLPTIRYLEDRWKKTDLPVIKTWKELHDFLKNSKLKYRVPIPNHIVFRVFSSKKSQVFKLDNFKIFD